MRAAMPIRKAIDTVLPRKLLLNLVLKYKVHDKCIGKSPWTDILLKLARASELSSDSFPLAKFTLTTHVI